MKTFRNRRILSAVCALALLLAAAFPTAAYAAEEVQPQQTLTASEARQMQQADAAVTALTDSDAYADMTEAERQTAAQQQLAELAEQGLVQKDSIYTDTENGMVSFAYTCGVWGGIRLKDLDDENMVELPLGDLADRADAEMEQTNEQIGRAVIYYAFDNTINSTRYPNYTYMRSYWNSVGLQTTLDTDVTVSDLRRMGNYDICVLSTHGAYYTYEYGLFWKRTATTPLVLLLEESNLYQDIRYGFDLLNHSVIKIDGMYAVTPQFFKTAYRGNKLNGSVVISESCEFYGRNGHVDSSIADALLANGAEAVVGYVNNVYAVYSRSMMWATVNSLTEGSTLGQAVDHAMGLYGSNDIQWYTSQGGRKPHAAASYPIISGSHDYQLTTSRTVDNVQNPAQSSTVKQQAA